MSKDQPFQIDSVAVVGTGLMGTGIAEVTALAGIPVTLIKATSGDPKSALERIEASMRRRQSRGKLEEADVERALKLITATTDREAAANCNVVIESIIEDLHAKQELFNQMSLITPHETVLATNTSTLKVSDLAPAERRDRTVGLHFFSPVPAMSLVELAHPASTDSDAIAAISAYVERIGKKPIEVIDSTGFVVNRLLVPYLLGAIEAYAEGVAGASQIDAAMKLGCGHPVGPLALSDLIGLDVVYSMSRLLYGDFGDSRYRPPAILRRMVQDGQLGKKSGLGFYDYSSKPAVENNELRKLVSGQAAELAHAS